jgi:hypothetical protein
MDIRFSYRDSPTIKAFSDCDAFIRGLMGPFGSGKSSACVVEILARAMAQQRAPDGVRRSRWAVIRNTFPQLKDTAIKTFHDWLPPRQFGEHRVTDHRYLITAFEDAHIEVLFRALDRPDDMANLLSLELTGAWVNEAREIPWPIIEALQSRVGRYPSRRDGGPTWHGIIMDTNPPDVDSKWYRFFEEQEHQEGFSTSRVSDLARPRPAGFREGRAIGQAELSPTIEEDFAFCKKQVTDSLSGSGSPSMNSK